MRPINGLTIPFLREYDAPCARRYAVVARVGGGRGGGGGQSRCYLFTVKGLDDDDNGSIRSGIGMRKCHALHPSIHPTNHLDAFF